MAVSDNLKKAREKNDLSYSELSQLTGIAKSTLQRYETGTTSKIPLDVIEKISIALKVSPQSLLDWEESSPDTLTNKIKKLPTDKQKEVEKIVDNLANGGTIAAHRTDNPMDDLPEEAIQSIEDFKKFVRAKYKKD